MSGTAGITYRDQADGITSSLAYQRATSQKPEAKLFKPNTRSCTVGCSFQARMRMKAVASLAVICSEESPGTVGRVST